MPTSIPPLSVRKNEINEVSLTVASIFLKKHLQIPGNTTYVRLLTMITLDTKTSLYKIVCTMRKKALLVSRSFQFLY